MSEAERLRVEALLLHDARIAIGENAALKAEVERLEGILTEMGINHKEEPRWVKS